MKSPLLWRVVRPTFWIIDRRIRKTSKPVIFLIIVMLGYGGQLLYTRFLQPFFDAMGAEGLASLVTALLPIWVIFLVLFGSLSLSGVIYRIYLAPDVELLLVVPIPRRTIYLFRLLQTSLTLLVPAAPLGVLLLVLGIVWQAAWVFYPLTLILMLAMVVLAAALTVSAAVLLPRLFSPKRVRTGLSVSVAILSFGYLVVQQPLMNWIAVHPATLDFLTTALLDVGRLALLSSVAAVAATLAAFGAYGLFLTAFYEGWNSFQEVPAQAAPPSARTKLIRPTVSSLLPGLLGTLVTKEWHELRRDWRALIGILQPLALLLFFALIGGGGGPQTSQTLVALLFWIVLMFVIFYTGFVPITTVMMAMVGEGVNIDLLRAAPVRIGRVLWGKFVAWMLPVMVVWGLAMILIGVVSRLAIGQVVVLAIIAIWSLAGASAISLALAARFGDYGAGDIKQRVPVFINYLMMGLNLVFSLLVIALAIPALVRLFPNRSSIVALGIIGGMFSPVGWLIGESAVPPIALLIAQVLAWAGIAWLWREGVQRLEGLEL